ncbi:hypothetical protein PYCCODRAFT_502774 [Trametes coccinea BRFM310]|uniref:Uncharacterized protein n=1 Tax=Trametes coccinea (strain BRFM310) TaxID=1353009 RepID=A0A1Y2IN34_TRAC3|nr:hypothetical protein PYCCODRAFT_502774 [Trametes coccinea BRFM310]
MCSEGGGYSGGVGKTEWLPPRLISTAKIRSALPRALRLSTTGHNWKPTHQSYCRNCVSRADHLRHFQGTQRNVASVASQMPLRYEKNSLLSIHAPAELLRSGPRQRLERLLNISQDSPGTVMGLQEVGFDPWIALRLRRSLRTARLYRDYFQPLYLSNDCELQPA